MEPRRSRLSRGTIPCSRVLLAPAVPNPCQPALRRTSALPCGRRSAVGGNVFGDRLMAAPGGASGGGRRLYNLPRRKNSGSAATAESRLDLSCSSERRLLGGRRDGRGGGREGWRRLRRSAGNVVSPCVTEAALRTPRRTFLGLTRSVEAWVPIWEVRLGGGGEAGLLTSGASVRGESLRGESLRGEGESERGEGLREPGPWMEEGARLNDLV